jgi:hypothetical protein
MTTATDSEWTTPEDLEAQVLRLWERGRLLSAADPASFPLRLRLRRPERAELSAQFERVRRWIRALEDASRTQRGFGYEIEWTETAHRQLGRNRVPSAVFVPSREDALRMIGKRRQAERFDELAASTLAAFPSLRSWLERRPLSLLEHADAWPQILAVLEWFVRHPRPGIYLRQVDIPGVDTKFIEGRRALLSDLLDLVLPPEAIDGSASRTFEQRYGLLEKRPAVRFRILDPSCRVGGLSEIATPVPELAALRPSVRRVFITENEINGLAFPEAKAALVIFGLGYGLDRLGEVQWLHDMDVHYWGDIDTHGFAILDKLRSSFPHARSLMMDRETLLEHRASWVEETSRHPGPLSRLTAAEQSCFQELVSDRLGLRVRLEQERIRFGWVKRAIAALE